MRRLSEEDMLRANTDPTFGRRLLDSIEAGVWPARRGGRRISARFGIPGSAAGRPPDLPPPQFATVGTDQVRTVYFPPAPAADTRQLARVLRRAK